MHTNLIVDLNNLVFITRFSKIKTPSSAKRKEEYVKELIFKEVIGGIAHFANEFKVDAIVVACDSPNVWRKDVFPEYKGNREHDDVYYKETIEAADLCKKFFHKCTNVGVLEVPRAEADDIIAVFCQESTNTKNVILSADKDFVQLIDERTTLYSPSQKVWRECEDSDYELFVKCVRGDRNDNIRSAYPRIRETALKDAWEDSFKMLNLMETVRKDGVKVADALNQNQTLIDLTKQPSQIRTNIINAINGPRQSSFGELKIMKFLSDHNLKQHADMFAYKEKPLKGKYVFNG